MYIGDDIIKLPWIKIYKYKVFRLKRNEIGSLVEMWMDLESVIQSEVSQKEKIKYGTLTHIWGI